MNRVGDDLLLASPKLNAISSSGRPHVRIAVCTYPEEDGREMYSHQTRVDLTIEDFRALIDGHPRDHVRHELYEALVYSGLEPQAELAL